MDKCCICSESAVGGQAIDDFVDGIEVRELIALILSLEVILQFFHCKKFSEIFFSFQTSPGSLPSIYLCAKCLEVLLAARHMKKKAEKNSMLRAYGLNPMAEEFCPATAAVDMSAVSSYINSSSQYEADTSEANDSTLIADLDASHLPPYHTFRDAIFETSSSFSDVVELERCDDAMPARVFMENFKLVKESDDENAEDHFGPLPNDEESNVYQAYNSLEASAFFINFNSTDWDCNRYFLNIIIIIFIDSCLKKMP